MSTRSFGNAGKAGWTPKISDVEDFPHLYILNAWGLTMPGRGGGECASWFIFSSKRMEGGEYFGVGCHITDKEFTRDLSG